MKILIRLVVSLSLLNNAYAFEHCNRFEQEFNFANDLCNAGEQITSVCNSVLGWAGPLALFCSMPGADTQVICDFRNIARKRLNNCIEHEKKIAWKRARHADGLAQRAAFIRPIIEKAIDEYKQVVNPSWDETHWRVEQIIKQMQFTNRPEEEILLEVDKYLKQVEANRPMVVYKAQQKFEMFFSQYMTDIAEQEYTEWDEFANECFIFGPPNPTRFSDRCLKWSCFERNIFLIEGSAQPICEDLL